MFCDGAVNCTWKPNGGGLWYCETCNRPFSNRVLRDTAPPPRNCTRPRTECQHLGDSTGKQECTSCQGTVRIKLYACAIHGETTLGKKLDGIACCDQCPDYAPSKRDAEVDDGRSG